MEATPAFDRKETLLVSPALVTLVEGRPTIQVTNPHNHTHTLDSCVAVANVEVMTLQHAEITKPVPHARVLLMNKHPGKCEHILNQLFHEQTETDAKRWYPTPETCDDPTKMNKIERSIYDEITTLRGKKQLNPTKADAQRKLFRNSTGMNHHSMRMRKPE